MATRAEVRQTLYNFLSTANIPNLNKVWTSMPKQINFQEGAVAGQNSRAQAFIFIEGETETRIALGGATGGKKRIDYDLVLQVFMHSLEQNSETVMDTFDTLIDDIKGRLRSDHRFGDDTGQLVWQGAEPSLNVMYGTPATSNRGATEIWAGIRFQVTQIFTA